MLNKDQIPAANEAVADFDSKNKDPKAAMGITYGYDPALNGMYAFELDLGDLA